MHTRLPKQRTSWQQGVIVLLLSGLTACSQLSLPLPAAKAVSPPASVATPLPLPLSAVQQQQFAQAKTLLSGADYNGATALLQALAAELPQAPGIGYNLALSQWQSGDIAGAQQSLQQVVSVAPQYSDAHNLLGVLARQQGNFRQAERHFQRALQANSDYATAHKNLAFLYELYLGEPLQAHYHYQQYYALTQDEQAKGWLALLEQQLA
ncbi:MAG TPA: tetratricopeptide repeat protein, partial [Rheinheimera sp.]|nr:tetratricopeptide repeat protein [Rheinheimera sp.]